MRLEPDGLPHPNLSDKLNGDIVRSEIEGGVYLNRISANTTLEVETQNRRYTLWVRENGEVLIWGHPVYCPAPTQVRITGSTWGGSLLKSKFIGRGMHLEFLHPEHKRIVTSCVRDIREVNHADAQRMVPVPLQK